ncbi:MAG: hypothetical protein HKN47_19785 [Pirellulaceae bacterium]|nr:hypothetical protein [Pirellulaceae bacterium]
MKRERLQSNDAFRWCTAGIAVFLVVILLFPLFIAFWPRVTAANYERIAVSMTMEEVQGILGEPEFDTSEFGILDKTGAYVTNNLLSDQEKIDNGYQRYRRLQWTSYRRTIVVVFDSRGQVATKYGGED